MRVLLTGGTGFVGAWTAKAVAEAGHQVRFLVRDPARLATSAAQIGVDTGDYAVGDIADAASAAAAMDGCDAVIHSAAMVSTDPRQADVMLATNLGGARNVLGLAAERGLDPIVHVSSFTALFRPGCRTLHADLPVAGGTDGYGKSKAEVEKYARGLQDAGAPVAITYPGMVLGPPAGNQFGEAAEGVQAAVQMRGVPGRGAAWTVVDVRDLAALHAALLEPGKGPRRYMAGGRRVELAELASMIGGAAEAPLRVHPIPDVLLRNIGRVVDVVGPYLPFDTPVTGAAMQYYTQMPSCDDSPSEADLGITYRDPQETLADTVSGLRQVGRL
ncbi:NAD-dependent epimerase/dehydratase family protein [Mycolicibacterium holsaticum]|uniref:NAD-dependent epimerase/dehydratase family protein n=1 Tax=Mycolicibacterium holsaticum TaxID=152142 RepID=UPI001C7CFE45|nr:NAD-dependent epimerase/dehydratase family protein [Mycolicibacterium holsaticum]MDA4106177.1 oxidoreductase [Mycolicibacterium holsaticum DSM 44478 = JCM 12374]QZA13500.1 NAD-dependent epimerase/dehydratase family protein [Mycolicibacterium holsaticum DSM 44478 = JCM 12374]UNC09035.1 NAD-dependent epimerase/dehydratase family protein [Mycolicibacterium holsaticum DSM 44478 = JCM 12374]